MNLYTHIPTNSDPSLEKFINCIMKCGKKTIARSILNDCFKELQAKWHAKPQEAFKKWLSTVMPNVEVRPKRVWWSVYQIPTPVSEKRQLFLAIRWILWAANKKKWVPMSKKLAIEINDALNETWEAYKKKEEMHKMAQANKAFAHFAKVA